MSREKIFVAVCAILMVAAVKDQEKPVVLVHVTGSAQVEKDVAAVANGKVGQQPKGAAKADATVTGSVKKGEGGWHLKLVVKDKSGKVLSRGQYQLKKQRLDAETQKVLKQDLAQALPAAFAPEPPAEALPPSMAATPAPTESLAVSDRVSEPARPVWRTLVDISGGLELIGRSFSTSNATDPKYNGSMVPGLRIDAAVYPMAGRGRKWAMLGADIRYVRTLAFDSTTASGQRSSTIEDAFGLGLRGRWILREDEMSPQLGARVGFGQRRFGTDADLGIPGVSYKYVELGVLGRLPIHSPRFALAAQLAYQAVVDSGYINDMASYGPGGANGVLLEGGAEYQPADKLSLRLGASYARYGLSFDGRGMKMATSASDSYYGAFATVGYLY